MNIRDWPMNRIMQLPDHCFGRRWEIIFGHHFAAAASEYRISDVALPDVCVLWELHVWFPELLTGAASSWAYCSVALGDHLPLTPPEMVAFEPLFPGCEEVAAGLQTIRGNIHLVNLRKPVMAQGRRVVVDFTSASAGVFDIALSLVFSSIPTEVPDCLLSV